MPITTQDIVKGVDFTGIAPGALVATDFNQAIDLATPASDKGFIIETTDSALSTPIVPNPAGTYIGITPSQWTRYIWKRIRFAGDTLELSYYGWNDNRSASDATYLKWEILNKTDIDAYITAYLAVTSIIASAIVDNIVTINKLADANFGAFKDVVAGGVYLEVWLAVRTDGKAGNGTLLDPFDASSATKFGAIINAIRLSGYGTTIHLLPGTYETYGWYYFWILSPPSYWYNLINSNSCSISTGMHIIGSGESNCIVKLIGPVNSGAEFVWVFYAAEGNNMSVENLTIDCNAANLTTTTCWTGSMALKGNNSYIKNVTILNLAQRISAYPHGSGVNEAFFASIGAEVNIPLVNVYVDGIKFEGEILCNPANSKQYTFILVTNSYGFGVYNSVIRNCYFKRLNWTNKLYGNAFDIAESHNCIIENNYTESADVGSHADSLQCFGLVLRGNRFINATSGFYFSNSAIANQAWRDIVIENNLVELRKDILPNGQYGSGIVFFVDTANAFGLTDSTYRVILRHNEIKMFGDDADIAEQNIGIYVAAVLGPNPVKNLDYFQIYGNVITIPNIDRRIRCDVIHKEIWGNKDNLGTIVKNYDPIIGDYDSEIIDTKITVERLIATNSVDGILGLLSSLYVTGLSIPSAVSYVPDGSAIMAFPKTGNLIYITGSGAGTTITSVTDVIPGVMYIIINTRASGNFVLTADATSIFGTTRTLAATPDAGVLLVIGIAPTKLQILAV